MRPFQTGWCSLAVTGALAGASLVFAGAIAATWQSALMFVAVSLGV